MDYYFPNNNFELNETEILRLATKQFRLLF
jgi:hypothetical protein